MKTKYFIKICDYVGLPKLSDFKIVEESIDESLNEEEVLTEAVVISVDPYIRAHAFPAGDPVLAFQAARVIKSRANDYPEGSIVLFHGGWKTINKVKKSEIWYRVDSFLSNEELTRAVGVVGMPGLTAYIGFLDLCKPEKGETVMVNCSAGAVGSLVGQIAKIKGCRVVGCCGSEEKMKFCKSIGFDDVFNYKTEKSHPDAIKKVAPEGIDCFFDNVGGQLASDTIAHMNKYGRISSCGCISAYNSTEKLKADIIQGSIAGKQLEMKGFIISDPRYSPKYPAAVKQMAEWMSKGQLVVRETITDGFENIPKAFIDMLCGGNIGKAVVRV